MSILLVVIGLAFAFGGAAAGAVLYRVAVKKQRGLASGGENRTLAAGEPLVERSLKELRVGDVVSLDGKDYVAECVIEYDEDGHRWVAGRLVDGDTVRWCVVGLERAGSPHVRVLELDPTDIAGYPPEVLVLGEIRFALDKRGTATCKIHGDLGNAVKSKPGKPEVERCRWWLYSAPGDDTAILEQWGSDYRVLRGKKVLAETIDLLPGS